MATTYKGVPMLKCPFDLALYQELLWDLKPKTILEFGSYKGGSALWLADLLSSFELDQTRLITLDINYLHEFTDPRIEFRSCDVTDIKTSLNEDFMKTLEHPLLVIEDSSHRRSDVLNVMEFFHEHAFVGDYLIVEDGVVSVFMDEAEFDGGPFRAIQSFLEKYTDSYAVDRDRCDRFGRNATWNIDGYIKRVK